MCEIYNDKYHGECIGRIEDGEVYDDKYHGDCVGRIEGDEIYNDKYHGDCVGRIEGDEIYNDKYHGDCVGRIEGDEVYNDKYHGDCVGRIEGSSTREGAAALLLLLSPDAVVAGSGDLESEDSQSDSSDDHDYSDESGGVASASSDTYSHYTSGGTAGYSPSSSSAKSGGLGVIGTIILIVIGLAIWSDLRKPAPATEQPLTTAANSRSNSSIAPDPWAGAISVPVSFREGADLKITAQNTLVFDGVPMGLPFRYIDRESPESSLLSEASATGRYRILTMCGVDWCDDARIIDLRRRLMAPFSGSKNGAAAGVLWSPDDRYAVIMRSHAGDSDFIALNTATLTVSQMTSLDSVFGNESGDLGGPGDLPRSSPHVRFDLSSAVWPAATRVEVAGDVYKTQWAENNGGWSGEPVRSGRIRLSISVPSMKFTVLDRTSVEPGNAPPEDPGARRMPAVEPVEDARAPANHALEPTARN
jgi:hypothetical protein